MEVACTSEGVTNRLTVDYIEPGATSVGNVSITGFPDMSFFDVVVNCSASLLYSAAGSARGTAALVDLATSRSVSVWPSTVPLEGRSTGTGAQTDTKQLKLLLWAPSKLLTASAGVNSITIDPAAGTASWTSLALSGSCPFSDEGWIHGGFGRKGFFIAHTGAEYQDASGATIQVGARYLEWDGTSGSSCVDVNNGTASEVNSRARSGPVSVVFGSKVPLFRHGLL
eukprot:tig00000396_g24902.t1